LQVSPGNYGTVLNGNLSFEVYRSKFHTRTGSQKCADEDSFFTADCNNNCQGALAIN